MTLLVDQAGVARLLPMADCIEAMEGVLAALARGEAALPLRQVLPVGAPGDFFATMPAALPHLGAFGVKSISVFPGNHGSALDAHQGAVLLFESGRGRLLAIVDATAVTAIRTAAVSAVATRLLARPGAAALAAGGGG